ncbi:hypothetical protein [Microbacterium hominis]|uniref:Uncharacterized protein n=1 Tax=Microbacterium hominis TaxID=162426 RepID=A0A7D4U3F6_9MICO|nr:hypothetical protein [Microbacterium hominis]QKJ18605.1 hypothetical protein HQM25_03870 [Microbacterium hominis]
MTQILDATPHAAAAATVSPLSAPRPAIGVSLVPRVRPLTRGGLSDLLALYRHERRHRSRAAA